MNTFRKNITTLFIIGLLTNLPTQAMYRGFSQARTIKIVVPAITLGSIYVFYKNNTVSAQEQLNNNINHIYNLAKHNNQKNNSSINLPQVTEQEHYFDNIKPEKTESLLKTEKYNKQDPRKTIFERINEKWIGEIPYQIQVLVSHLINYKNEPNVMIPNIILLYGNPGLGKTLLVKTIAEELEFPLFTFTSSIFTDKYIGESSKKIRTALQKIKKMAEEFKTPSLIFIDEFDAIASARNSGTHAEYRNIMATLLTELESLTNNKKVIVFAATNDFSSLDEAIKSRFSACKIETLSTEHKTIFIKKIFAEQGIIDNQIAEGLAELLNESTYTLKKVSNREIKRIIQFARAKQINNCQINPNLCSNHICFYLREAIVSTVISESEKINFGNLMTKNIKYMGNLEEKIPGLDKFVSCHNEPIKEEVNKKKKEIQEERKSSCIII